MFTLPRISRPLTLEQGTSAEGQTVAEVILSLDSSTLGLAAYIVDECGSLRKHVNIFVNDELVIDRERLSDAVGKRRAYLFSKRSRADRKAYFYR